MLDGRKEDRKDIEKGNEETKEETGKLIIHRKKEANISNHVPFMTSCKLGKNADICRWLW